MTINVAIRRVAALGILLFTSHVQCQQTTTTNTDCNLYGNTANCNSTSTTTDTGAQQAERNREAYETGQKIGTALGQGMAGAMQAHSFSKGLRKYCDAHPGQEWAYYSRADGHKLSSGHCPSNDEKALAAANEFMARHTDFKPGPANSQAITAYLETHKLDPREEKSYERAYKELKNTSQLDLYAK
jgi:hypothetical protein